MQQLSQLVKQSLKLELKIEVFMNKDNVQSIRVKNKHPNIFQDFKQYTLELS